MSGDEVGEKTLRAIRRGDFYVLTHPEFREELQETFDEVLASLPGEEAPADRLEVEAMRRAGKAQAKQFWR
jgi:hypothetical protein